MEDKKIVCTHTDAGIDAGFMMTFENGLTVSIQWGMGNYCSNHLAKEIIRNDFGFIQSNNAEVALFHGSVMRDANPFVPEQYRSCDTVCGYLPPDAIAEFIYNVKNWRA